MISMESTSKPTMGKTLPLDPSYHCNNGHIILGRENKRRAQAGFFDCERDSEE
jgi:hypothetical protein